MVLEKGGAFKATYIEGPHEEKVIMVADPINETVRLDFVTLINKELREEMYFEKSRNSTCVANPLMTPEDIKFLEKSIVNHGFPDIAIIALHDEISKGKKLFEIKVNGRHDDTEYQADLKFKTDDLGKVNFKTYRLAVSNADVWKETFVQIFPVGRGLNLNLNEALNLMLKKPVLINMSGETMKKIASG
jgi:hypothetical protein